VKLGVPEPNSNYGGIRALAWSLALKSAARSGFTNLGLLLAPPASPCGIHMSGSMSGDWNRGLNQGLTGPVLDSADSLEGADREEVGDTPVVSVTLRRDDVQRLGPLQSSARRWRLRSQLRNMKTPSHVSCSAQVESYRA
jgi:hypothetical protein